VLQAPLLTFGDLCLRTPTYYALHMLQPHRGGVAVRVSSPYMPSQDLSVSASTKKNVVALTIVNPDPEVEKTVMCRVQGAGVLQARGILLTHADLNACNSPEKPDAVMPCTWPVGLDDGVLSTLLPANSVLQASITLQGPAHSHESGEEQ
jgi:alpha-N-arabinofuranosidase